MIIKLITILFFVAAQAEITIPKVTNFRDECLEKSYSTYYTQRMWTKSKANLNWYPSLVSVTYLAWDILQCYSCFGIVIGQKHVLIQNCGEKVIDKYNVFASSGAKYESEKVYTWYEENQVWFRVIELKSSFKEKVAIVPLSKLNFQLPQSTEVTILQNCANVSESMIQLISMNVKRDCKGMKDDQYNVLPKNPHFSQVQSCIIMDGIEEKIDKDFYCNKKPAPVLIYNNTFYALLRDEKVYSKLPVAEDYPYSYFQFSPLFLSELESILK